MTPDQIALVQDSFGKVPAEAAADLFYDRLFELDPALRSLFPENMVAQKQELMTMLALAVGSLGRIDQLLPVVQALGRRHGGYGIEPGHYETVGAALLWTLKQGIGETFTPDVEQAWGAAYGLLSTTMIEAAEEVAA